MLSALVVVEVERGWVVDGGFADAVVEGLVLRAEGSQEAGENEEGVERATR